ERAGVDLPLGDAFDSSVLAGRHGDTFYLHLPMPYRRQGFLRIDSERSLSGTIRLLTERRAAPDAGYLRAISRTGLTGESDGSLSVLAEAGGGHFGGAFLSGADQGTLQFRVGGQPRGREFLAARVRDVSASRWHLGDVVPYTRSIAVNLDKSSTWLNP